MQEKFIFCTGSECNELLLEILARMRRPLALEIVFRSKNRLVFCREWYRLNRFADNQAWAHEYRPTNLRVDIFWHSRTVSLVCIMFATFGNGSKSSDWKYWKKCRKDPIFQLSHMVRDATSFSVKYWLLINNVIGSLSIFLSLVTDQSRQNQITEFIQKISQFRPIILDFAHGYACNELSIETVVDNRQYDCC